VSRVRRAGTRRNAATIALGSLACLLMVASVRAGEFSLRADSLSALREFAETRQIAPAENPTTAFRFGTVEAGAADDRAYRDLRDFAERLGEAAPPVVWAKGEKAKPATKTIVKAEGEATYVGAQVCLGCHAAQAAAFGVTLMGKIFRNPRNPQERANCETCHGPGSLHVKAGGGRGVGGIISFRLDDQTHTADEFNAICLSCHEKGNRVLWRGSTHETRGLACTNCHTIMTNVTPKHQLAQLTEMDTCFQCHKNKRAEIWRSSHMPLREGKMTCSNCHNPHGSYSEALLKETTVNDNCYKCHAEKRGPFLWEHAPVRENCLNCHDPHGSNNDFLLKISRPRLCQQCHANLTGHPGNPRNPKSIYAVNRECQNCHSQHHGSNSPAGSRFIR
jgi:DmsE family decaheme c-type cytochrome